MEAIVVEVRLDGWLREFGARDVRELRASTVGDLIDQLEDRYPRLRFKLRDETGTLRKYIRVFLDGNDVSGAEGVRASLSGVQTVDILHSIAGG